MQVPRIGALTLIQSPFSPELMKIFDSGHLSKLLWYFCLAQLDILLLEKLSWQMTNWNFLPFLLTNLDCKLIKRTIRLKKQHSCCEGFETQISSVGISSHSSSKLKGFLEWHLCINYYIKRTICIFIWKEHLRYIAWFLFKCN